MATKLNLDLYDRALDAAREGLDLAAIPFDESKHPRLHGKFAKAIGGLQPGQALTTPDGIRVRRRGAGLPGYESTLTKHGFGRTTHDTAAEAAQHVLDKSAHNETAHSLGGAIHYKDAKSALDAMEKGRAISGEHFLPQRHSQEEADKLFTSPSFKASDEPGKRGDLVEVTNADGSKERGHILRSGSDGVKVKTTEGDDYNYDHGEYQIVERGHAQKNDLPGFGTTSTAAAKAAEAGYRQGDHGRLKNLKRSQAEDQAKGLTGRYQEDIARKKRIASRRKEIARLERTTGAQQDAMRHAAGMGEPERKPVRSLDDPMASSRAAARAGRGAGRSKSGNMRNFKAMRDTSLNNVTSDVIGQGVENDLEAAKALYAEHVRRGTHGQHNAVVLKSWIDHHAGSQMSLDQVVDPAEFAEMLDDYRGLLNLALGHESLNRSPKKNWVENAGELPAYIQHIAKDIVEDPKSKIKDLSQAIPIAISQVKKWAAGGGNVKPETRAKAATAVAEWEKLKAKNKAKQAA